MVILMMATHLDDKVYCQFKIGDITSPKLEPTYTFSKITDM